MPSPQPSEAAVEAAAQALFEGLPTDAELRGGQWVEDPLGDEWGEWAFSALDAALPALRAQVLEEVREGLRGEIKKQEAEDHHWCNPNTDRTARRCACGLTQRLLRLQAAVEALTEDSDGDG